MADNKISLALQGGGAHGAFTWGVLERLLEEPNLTFDGISGSSAGAMNALMMAQGWLEGGREGAIAKLDLFWHSVAQRSQSQWMQSDALAFFSEHATHSLNQMMMAMTSKLSPYDLNLLDYNPLREIVAELTDFAALRAAPPFKLFIAATQVRTGKICLFRETELDQSRMLASACLPTLHKAVEVDGEAYWDGEFSGNPAVYPLIFDCKAADLLIVHLQPLAIDHLPRNAAQIADRIAEIGFHSTFLREMRAIAYTCNRSKRSWLAGSLERRFKKLRFHLIDSSDYMTEMSRASKYDTRWDFLCELKACGRQHAERWLHNSGAKIGRESSYDIEKVFL